MMSPPWKERWHFPKTYNTYFVALIATMGGMLFGFDISSMSAIIGTQQYLDYFDNPHGTLQGAIGSALAAGSIVGAACAGVFSDWLGRRDAIWWSCIWWLLGTALQVSTTGWQQLIAGRFLNGICVGVTSSQVPVLLAEISKHEKRGALIVIQQLAVEWGILLMYFIGYGCSFIPGPSAGFRVAWAMQLVPCVALMAGLPFCPESPRWYAKKGMEEQAITTLARIQAKGDTSDPLVQAEWQEIMTVLEAERAAYPGWRKFVYNGMWRRTFVGFSVQAWQQLSGANVMTYYIVYVFAMAGLTGNINLISSGVQYAVFIIGSTATFFFVDHVGRRSLLIYGAISMAICFFVVGGLLGAYSVPFPEGVGGNANVVIRATGAPAYAVIAFSYLLVLAYALTLAPICWVYAAEIWSLETRASGMGISAVGNWTFNFALGFFIPPGFRNITWKMFIIFGTLCLGAAIQSFFTYPETCQKTLEEIEPLFRKGGARPWKTSKGRSVLEEHMQVAVEASERGLSLQEYERDRKRDSEATQVADQTNHMKEVPTYEVKSGSRMWSSKLAQSSG